MPAISTNARNNDKAFFIGVSPFCVLRRFFASGGRTVILLIISYRTGPVQVLAHNVPGLFHEGERRTFEIHTGRDEQMQSRRIKVMKEKRAKLPLELRKVFLFSLVSLAHGMKGLVQRFYPIKDIFPEQIQRIRKIKHEIRDWKFNILLQSGKAKDIVCKFSDKRQVIL